MKSNSFLSNDNDSIKVDLKGHEAIIANLAQKVDRFEVYVNEGFEDITDHTEYLENQSRRNNLKILGVPETTDEKSWDETERRSRLWLNQSLVSRMNLKVNGHTVKAVFIRM